jgi:hypothetical protein
MNRDGTVNYLTFSNDELLEACEGIDPKSYPVNFKNLSDEMVVRSISTNIAPQHSPLSFGSKIRAIVFLSVISIMGYVFHYGVTRFPDSPIAPCGTDQYCGKQGQLHTAEEFKDYHRWETTMLFLWPGGFITFAVLGLIQRRRA